MLAVGEQIKSISASGYRVLMHLKKCMNARQLRTARERLCEIDAAGAQGFCGSQMLLVCVAVPDVGVCTVE